MVGVGGDKAALFDLDASAHGLVAVHKLALDEGVELLFRDIGPAEVLDGVRHGSKGIACREVSPAGRNGFALSGRLCMVNGTAGNSTFLASHCGEANVYLKQQNVRRGCGGISAFVLPDVKRAADAGPRFDRRKVT